MSLNRTQFSESIVPGIKMWMDDEYKQFDQKYKKVANFYDSEKAYEDFINSTGINLLSKVAEDGEITRVNPLQGYKTRLTHESYGKYIPISYVEQEDDLYGIANIETNARKIGKAAARTEDKNFFSMLTNGWDTSYTSYGDAKPLSSILHPRKDGGTVQVNTSASSIVLDEPALFTAETAITEVLDDVGEEIDEDGKFLLMIPPALKKTGFEILKSDLQQGTGDNDTNYYMHGATWDMMVVPYLGAYSKGTDTQWHVVRIGGHKLSYIQREAFNTRSYEWEPTKETRVEGYERHSYGWLDWRGYYSSKGDTTTVST